MHKMIHKLIHFRRGNINVIADVNATVTTGDSGVATSSAASYSRIVQRSGRVQTKSGATAPKTEEVNDDEGDR